MSPLQNQSAFGCSPSACDQLTDYRCFFCVGERIERLLEMYDAAPATKHSVVAEVARRYADHGHQMMPAEFTRELYALVAKTFPKDRPFWPYKKKMNDKALELQSLLKVKLKIAGRSFRNSLRISLIGNAIDFLNASHNDVIRDVESVFHKSLAIDDTALLKSRIFNGAKVLFLGDKAGEIVFDRLFIRNIPGASVTYIVHCPYAGLAASGQDADYIDMRKCAKVLANGCQAPATIPNHASDRLQEAFAEADVIIVKGVSQLETFYPLHDDRIFALTQISCNVLAQYFHVQPGDLVAMHLETKRQELARLREQKTQ